MKCFKFLLLFIFVFPLNFYGDYLINYKNDWIIPAKNNIKNIDTDNNFEGIYYLLYDKQIKVSEDKFETYYHFILQYQNYYGLKYLSRVNIHYDPSHQQLILHKINIKRNNQIYDKLNTKFIRIQNNYYYENFKNINIDIEDLEIGDILEYEFTLVSDNSIFDGRFFDTQQIKWDLPIGALHYRILVPENKKIYINNSEININFKKNKYKNFDEYQWDLYDISPSIDDVSTPKWLSIYPYIQVSEFESWKEVTDWALKYYKPNIYDLKAVDKIIKKILKGKELDLLENKLSAILSFVQNDIKYKDVYYSSIPFRPAEVIKKMSGDCKDKSFLLATLLNRIGVEAYSVLVNSEYGKLLNNFHPTPAIFNHVITLIEFNNLYYWIDPTLTMQGSKLKNIYQKNFYYGLIIAQNENKLTKMDIKNNDLMDKKTMIKYKFNKDFNGHAELFVESFYQGKSAEEVRNILDEAIIRAIEKKNIKYFNSFYPNIEKLKDFEFNDNLNKNRIYTKESYIIPESWDIFHNKNKYIFKIYGFDFERFLSYPDSKRSQPFSIEYPVNLEQEISISLPKANWKIENYAEKIANNNFQFDFTVKYNKNELNIFYKFVTLNDYVSKNELHDYLKDIDRINKNINYEISLEKLQKSDSEQNYKKSGVLFLICLFIFIFFIVILPLLPDFLIDLFKLIDNKLKIRKAILFKGSVSK